MSSNHEIVNPPNVGWVKTKLKNQEMDYMWDLIDDKRESWKKNLAGQIDSSYIIVDKKDWFFRTVIRPLIKTWKEEFGELNEGNNLSNHPLVLTEMWVNHQKQGEYNPLHHHFGLFSFVIWMKIPTRHEDQRKSKNVAYSNVCLNSSFTFQYLDILGRSNTHIYHLNPEDAGTVLLFPSSLWHQVYPFYNCDETRISVSGNVACNTYKTIR